MKFWELFGGRSQCRLGFGLRDCEPVWDEVDLWVVSRAPEDILAIVRFAAKKRLPVASWLAHVDHPTHDDMRLLAEVSSLAKALTICAPSDQHTRIHAGLNAIRRSSHRAELRFVDAPPHL